jgi:hypothetical protein
MKQSRDNNHNTDNTGAAGQSVRQQVDAAVALADSSLGIPPARYDVAGHSGWASPVETAASPGSVARGDLSKNFGVPGTPVTGGFLIDPGEYNPELMGRAAMPIYEQMRRGDAQVRATLTVCKLPVASAKWEVIPAGLHKGPRGKIAAAERVSSNGSGRQTQSKAQEVAAFVKENLFGGLEVPSAGGAWSSQARTDVVKNALLMLDFGCAAHEEVWTVDGPHLRLLAARLPLTFYRWHTDEDGETLLALEQYGYRGGRYLNVRLPAGKIAVFTYNQEAANFWGVALLRAMYPHWYVKSKLYRIDAIACERNSLGIPVWKLPPGFSKEDRDAAFNFVTQLAAHEATGAVEPPGDESTGFRLVGIQGQVRNLMPSIQHHNLMISRVALALFMDLATADHGSRSLGEQQGDFFLLALQSLADQIAQVLNLNTVRRLVEFNFGAGTPVPRLVVANLQSRGLSAMVSALTQLAQAGLVVSEENLRRFIREELALPEESAQDLVAVRGETINDSGDEVEGRSGGRIQSTPETGDCNGQQRKRD